MPNIDLPLVGLCKKCRHVDVGLVKNGEFQCSSCIAAEMQPSTIHWSTTISTNTDTSSTTNWRP